MTLKIVKCLKKIQWILIWMIWIMFKIYKKIFKEDGKKGFFIWLLELVWNYRIEKNTSNQKNIDQYKWSIIFYKYQYCCYINIAVIIVSLIIVLLIIVLLIFILLSKYYYQNIIFKLLSNYQTIIKLF